MQVGIDCVCGEMLDPFKSVVLDTEDTESVFAECPECGEQYMLYAGFHIIPKKDRKKTDCEFV
jgi:hypothetical protein